MDMTDDNGSMDMSMDMSMTMTFSSWSSYELKLLFDWWNIQTPLQLSASAAAVFIATIGLHWIRYRLLLIEELISRNRSNNYKSVNPDKVIDDEDTLANSQLTIRIKGDTEIPFKKRLLLFHAFVNAINYGLALLLMLVAMSYNPWLFISLLLGYGVGDYLFYYKQLTHQIYVKNDQDCH